MMQTEAMTESKFNMWRACVAAVHIDGFISPQERAWVEEKIHKLPLTNDQKLTLIADLEDPQDFENFFSKITDKRDLAFLLNTLRVIAYLDKNFSDKEKEKYKKLETMILKGLDLNKIALEVEAIEKNDYHRDQLDNPSSTFERMFRSLKRYIE
jgi:tellurite resistance protein